MRFRGNGGIKGPLVSTSTTGAAGIWSMTEFQQKKGAAQWPEDNTSLLLKDDYFPYTTLLLKSLGSNTQQNYTFLDSSTNAYTVTRNGDTTQGAVSPFSREDGGWSNYFDGTGDYFTVPNNAAFNFGTGDFTVECWVYTTAAAAGSTHVIASTYQDGTNGWTIGVYFNTNVLYFAVAGDGGQLNDTSTVPLNRWVHIAAVRSGTTMSLFIDGVRKATTTNSTNQTSTSALTIGTNVGGGALTHTGYISNLRIVKGTAVYDPSQSTLIVPISPLTAVSGTSILTCQSNRFKDNSTNNFTLTRNGNIITSTFSPVNASVPYNSSLLGGSAYFDGTGDYLTAGSSVSLSGDFTVECWVYGTSLATEYYLYCLGNDYQPTGATFLINVSGYPRVYTNNAHLFSGTSVGIRLGQWNHVAFVRSSNIVRAYINGVLADTSSTYTASLSGLSHINAELNGVPGTTYVGGTCFISNLRVNATAVYTSAFTPPTSPVAAISGTSLLINGTNAAAIDASRNSVLYTVGNAQSRTNIYKYDKSVYFDGTGDYIQAPTYVTDFGTNDFTIEGWVYKVGGTPIVTNADGGSDVNYFSLDLNSANTQFQIRDSFSQVYAYGSAVTANTWTHVAVTRTSGTVRVFVNGTAGTPVSITKTITARRTIVGAFLYTGFDSYFNGYIEDLRITKFSRYTSNFTPAVASLPTR